jgi:hypothetical protein
MPSQKARSAEGSIPLSVGQHLHLQERSFKTKRERHCPGR